MLIRCCIDCQEDEVEVVASFTCQTCSRHLCDYHSKIHSRKNKDHQVSSVSSSSEEKSSISSSNKCTKHQLEINCFCRDCEDLTCPVCAVDGHAKHNVFLISKIVEEERKIVKDQLDLHLKQRDEWMKQNSISEQVLQNELGLIEHVGTDLKNQINTLFEQLKDKLNQRREFLLKCVENECKQSDQLVRQVLDLNDERKILVQAFSGLLKMDGNELLIKKINLLKKSETNFINLTSKLKNVCLTQVHNIYLEDTQVPFQTIEQEVEKLGTVKTNNAQSSFFFTHSKSSILNIKNFEKKRMVLVLHFVFKHTLFREQQFFIQGENS